MSGGIEATSGGDLLQRIAKLEKQVAALSGVVESLAAKTRKQGRVLDEHDKVLVKHTEDIRRLAGATATQQEHITDLDARVDKLEGQEPSPLPPIDIPDGALCAHTPYAYPDGRLYRIPAPVDGNRGAPVRYLNVCSVCRVAYGER